METSGTWHSSPRLCFALSTKGEEGMSIGFSRQTELTGCRYVHIERFKELALGFWSLTNSNSAGWPIARHLRRTSAAVEAWRPPAVDSYLLGEIRFYFAEAFWGWWENWMRPTHITEGNLLYSKSISLIQIHRVNTSWHMSLTVTDGDHGSLNTQREMLCILTGERHSQLPILWDQRNTSLGFS